MNITRTLYSTYMFMRFWYYKVWKNIAVHQGTPPSPLSSLSKSNTPPVVWLESVQLEKGYRVVRVSFKRQAMTGIPSLTRHFLSTRPGPATSILGEWISFFFLARHCQSCKELYGNCQVIFFPPLRLTDGKEPITRQFPVGSGSTAYLFLTFSSSPRILPSPSTFASTRSSACERSATQRITFCVRADSSRPVRPYEQDRWHIRRIARPPARCCLLARQLGYFGWTKRNRTYGHSLYSF